MIQVDLYRATCDLCSSEKVGDIENLVSDLAKWLIAGPLAICSSHGENDQGDELFRCESCGVSWYALFAGNCERCWIQALRRLPSRATKVQRLLEHRFYKGRCVCGEENVDDPEAQAHHLLDVIEGPCVVRFPPRSPDSPILSTF